MDFCILNFYRRKTKFGKVMFSHVSVCPQGVSAFGPGGVSATPPRQTPPWTDTPLADTPSGRHRLWADTPQADTSSRHPKADPPVRHPPRQTPPAQCMLGHTHTHPCLVHAEIRSTSGRYASPWNEFL